MPKNKLIILLILLVLPGTTVFYGQTALGNTCGDSTGVHLSDPQFDFYAGKYIDCQELEADTANLNFQVKQCDKETAKLRESVASNKMALSAKNESLKTVMDDNEKLRVRVVNAEVKVTRRGNFILVLGATSILLLGLLLVR